MKNQKNKEIIIWCCSGSVGVSTTAKMRSSLAQSSIPAMGRWMSKCDDDFKNNCDDDNEGFDEIFYRIIDFWHPLHVSRVLPKYTEIFEKFFPSQ